MEHRDTLASEAQAYWYGVHWGCPSVKLMSDVALTVELDEEALLERLLIAANESGFPGERLLRSKSLASIWR
jgi:hypothetical protein